MSYETILVERHDAVGLIRLNRPQALNALNAQLLDELAEALDGFEADSAIGCIVLTGSERAFAAGADIKMMAEKTFADVLTENLFADADRLARCRKPTIAAVAGFALGGGCELAMMADMIFAADTAKFGQPEIKLGVIPGIGGTQRLVRAVGKAKAMDLCLTGRMMDAKEAEAVAAAKTIAGFSQPSLMLCKEAINAGFETSLAEGVRFERRAFHALFATQDQKEGMAAFIEKRPAKFTNA
jgi:enoyl-CoA hydratase